MADQVIFVAGHQGMVGSAICAELRRQGHEKIVTRTRDQLDLRDQAQVNAFFQASEIDEVYLAAARVGGIYANNHYPAEFISENLTIQSNVIHAAHRSGVDRLLFLGSSCIYPRDCAPNRLHESALLFGAARTNQ